MPYTPIEETDISKSTNRFTSNTTYDDAGQVVADNKFRSFGFAYDANGRQVKATKTNQPDAWTVYDALGNRVATKINDVWQFMIYDAFGKLVAEYGVKADNTGGVKYVQQDWQGSVRAVTNSNGFVVARTDHQAFGEDIGIGTGLRSVEQGYSADKATRQGYGLTEDDQSTGQQHTWFRKLETQAGRWSSPDPYKGSMSLGDPQSFNRYAYVTNDPTNFVDPTGLDDDEVIVINSPGRHWPWRWEEVTRAGPGRTGGSGTSSSGRGGSRGSQPQTCPVAPLKPITDPAALQYEAGDRVVTSGLTKGTQGALMCLQLSVNPYQAMASFVAPGVAETAAFQGRTLEINSAYRPQAYQDHLLEVWDKWKALQGNKQKECQATKQQVDREKGKLGHDLAERPSDTVSNHTRGTAIDVNFTGLKESQINSYLKACQLKQGKGHSGAHHLNFTGREP